jgi:hypothetical protein
MNFKKTLVALATAGFVSGAMASDVELDNGIWTLSQEGISIENTASLTSTAADVAVFDFFLTNEIPASGKVAITFGEGFNALNDIPSFDDVAIDSTTTTPDDLDALGGLINYGSASFTFVKYSWNKDTRTVTLTLGNGQPLLGGASFGLRFDGNTAGLEMKDVATVSVKSMTKDDAQIEAFDVVVSEIKPEYAVSVVDVLSDEIDALERDMFVDGATTTDTSKQAKVRVTKQDGYKASADLNEMKLTLMGEFDETTSSTKYWGGDFTVSGATLSGTDAITTTGDDKGNYVVTVDGGTIGKVVTNPATGVADDFVVFYTSDSADQDSLVTPFTVKADLAISGAPASVEPIEYLATQAFGAWDLEGGVINVPYLPVNYPHLSANVEISNEDTKDAVIYVEAFDQDGNYYPRVQLAQVAAGKTVTKVSDADLINAFGLAGNRKLSVTFTFDAEGDADLITLAPYYRQNESRINVLSDEYKGK